MTLSTCVWKKHVQKGILFRIEQETECCVTEYHADDHTYDICRIIFILKQGEYGILGNEYKSPLEQKRNAKRPNILYGIFSVVKKENCLGVADMKRNMMSFEKQGETDPEIA